MTNPDHDQGGPEAGQRLGRNRRTAIGVVGLAAALGVSALVVTNRGSDESPAPTAAEIPATPATTAASSAPAAAATSNAATPTHPAQVAASPSPSTVEQRLAQARSANERLGTGARPAKPPANGGFVVDASQITTVSTGNLKKDRKTLRVVSAPANLAGQRELAWVADDGEPYRGARCSQSIQMSNNVVPKTRPTLLICWRTSETRSAYTLLVDLDKKPSKAESIDALNRAWSDLG